ncbi:MAG: type I glutamate--ammonia ligase [Actinomycetota bacterium]
MARIEASTAKEIVTLIDKEGVEVVDLRFCDVPGLMQHFSTSPEQIDDKVFEEGIGFDGSSIRGFQEIQESDMILLPDPSTAFIDPFLQAKTLVLNCWVRDPVTGEQYSRDPRYIAKKAEDHLVASGIASHSFWGPEAEFYIFDSVRFDQNQHSGYYFIDAVEGIWNSGAIEEGGNKGYKPRYKEGYFPVPPMDHYQDLRSEMILNMKKVGISVEVHHHEVGTAGQAEIDMGFGPLLQMADNLMLYKYVTKNTALRNGKTVTFMPKPIFEDNGSGMHVHSSLWRDDEPLFWGTGYAGLSELARWYIGGLLAHAPALCAIVAPTTNSYRRLVPGYEAPVNLVYSQRNRSAAVRIPLYSNSPRSKRVEFRCPDPSCNPYLAFAGMLMAGLDGIKRNIEPPEPINRDLYELGEEEAKGVPQVPGSLEEALQALEQDHDFLLEGGVFTRDLIDTWIAFKRKREIDPVNLRPHPWEFYMYYDI